MENMKPKLIFLVLIIALGSFVRLVLLDQNPPALNWDEVSHGYNAYSIAKTGGYDQWNAFLPLVNFRAYGDYPLPMNLYITLPFVTILGLGEFAVRFPHALLGIFCILLTYLFTKKLTKQEGIALTASFIFAISPWTIFTSRTVLQANVAVFFLLCSAVLFLYREKNKIYLPAAIVCLGLTLFSYHSTRIFSPLLLVGVSVLFYKELKQTVLRHKSLSVIIFVALISFFGSLPIILMRPESRARSEVLFLLSGNAIGQIEQARNTSTLSPAVARLLYNRPVYLAKEFSKNYLEYFSPTFLFFQGGTQYQFSIPNTGLLYFLYMPFFYVGFLIIILRSLRGDKNAQFVGLWILLAPIPASITNEHFAVVRAMTMLPLPAVLSAIGVYRVAIMLRRQQNLFMAGIAIVSLLLLERYVALYFGSYRETYSWSWQYGYKEAVAYAKENYNNYDKIIFTKKYGEAHEFVLFYWPWDPQKYLNDKDAIRFNQSSWWWVDKFDKFYFVNDWLVRDLILESGGKIICDTKCLLITSPGNFPGSWQKIKTIQFLDEKPAFEIYENH